MFEEDLFILCRTENDHINITLNGNGDQLLFLSAILINHIIRECSEDERANARSKFLHYLNKTI